MAQLLLRKFQLFAEEAGVTATLALTNLRSTDVDPTSPYSSSVGVRVRDNNGQVHERQPNGSWAAQNAGTEWIDDAGATSEDYEVKVLKTSGSGINPTNVGSWLTINQIWTFGATVTIGGNFNWNGTMEIREIANISNTTGAVGIVMIITNSDL